MEIGTVSRFSLILRSPHSVALNLAGDCLVLQDMLQLRVVNFTIVQLNPNLGWLALALEFLRKQASITRLVAPDSLLLRVHEVNVVITLLRRVEVIVWRSSLTVILGMTDPKKTELACVCMVRQLVLHWPAW